jgi:hypothetical protein
LEPSFPRVDSRAAGSLFSPNLKEEETEEQEDVKKIEIVDPENMEEDDAEDDVFNPYLFIANLPPHAWVATKGEARLFR